MPANRSFVIIRLPAAAYCSARENMLINSSLRMPKSTASRLYAIEGSGQVLLYVITVTATSHRRDETPQVIV